MKASLLRLLSLTLLFALESTAREEKGKELAMSLPDALGALTRMASEGEWNKVPWDRPVPAKDQFKEDKETGWYRSGPWTLHLTRKTFVFCLVHKQGGMMEFSGTFTLDAKGQWRAQVTQKRFADPPLPRPK